ncbi:hypothetical protein MJO29_008323 [Puccinia striiformis f. sp. tritici]|nr:hypothetical protein MJO29_008323 [Puccinia striiformis f. sp. tritici]
MIAAAGTGESWKRAEDRKREKYGDTDMLPPSPFLKGWDSVNPDDYPYPMPTRERQNAKNSLDQPIKPSASISPTDSKVPTNIQPQLHPQQPREVGKAPVPAETSKHSTITAKDLPPTALGTSEAQTPSLIQDEPSQNISQAVLPLGNHRNSKRDPKPPNIFIQKNKIPKFQKNGRNETTTAAEGANTPLFKPPSQPTAAELGSGMDEDDPCVAFLITLYHPEEMKPYNALIVAYIFLYLYVGLNFWVIIIYSFANWSCPQEAPESEPPKKKKTNHLRIESDDVGSPGPLLEELRLEELKKPLKLDRNLLEIIVRSVIVKIKLLESRKYHEDVVDTLENFKSFTIGLHPKHSDLFGKKLDEAVNKVRIVQSEYDKVTNTIEDELKSSIEDSVLMHSQILTSITINPSGLFTDSWCPKPVECVEINNVLSSNHGKNTRVAQQEDIQFDTFLEKRSQPVETTKNVEKGDPWAGGWGDDTMNQTINPVPDTAPVTATEECPWGNDEPTEPITSNKPPPGTKQKSDDPFGWDNAGDKTVPAPVAVDNGFAKPVSDQSGWGDPETSTPQKEFNQAPAGSGWGNPDTLTPNNAFTPGGSQGGWGNQDNGSNQSFGSQDRGWGGRGGGFRGGRGGFSDGGGFRGRGGEDRGGFGGRGRGFNGERGGFRGRGRGDFASQGGYGGGENAGSWGGNAADSNTGGWGGNAAGNNAGGWGGNTAGNNGGGWGGNTAGNNASGWGAASPGEGASTEGGGWGGYAGGADGNRGGRGGFRGARGGRGAGGGFNNRFGNNNGGFGAQGFKSGAPVDDVAAGWQSVKPEPPNRQAVNYDSIAPEVPDKLNEWGAPSPKAKSALANPVDVNSKGDQTNNPNDLPPKPTEQLENPNTGKTFNDWDGATKSEEKTEVLDYEGKMVIDTAAGEPMQVEPTGQVDQVEPANQVAQEASAPKVSEKPAVDDEWSGCPW